MPTPAFRPPSMTGGTVLPDQHPMSNASPSATKLSGRTALVTGAGTGIGQATAIALAEAGAFVGIHYHASAQGAKQTLATIEQQGGRGVLCPGDLTDPVAARNIVQTVQTAGGDSISSSIMPVRWSHAHRSRTVRWSCGNRRSM